jgi:hypothetical protein
MADLNYDPSPLFDLLPSFWRDSFEDRDKLSAVYEAYLRLADADYAALFTADDNKDATTLRPTRFMPLQYQEMADWEILQAKHSHCYFNTSWPAPTRGKYIVYLADKVLGPTNLIFGDSSYLPPFLYSVRPDWWIESDKVVRGTIVEFDEARVLRYFTATYGDPNLCYTNSAGTGSVDFNDLRIIGFDPKEILTVDADSTTREYTFGSDYDLAAGTIRLEFADVSRRVRIQDGGSGEFTLFVPGDLARNARGLVELDDGTFRQINFAPTIKLSLGLRTVEKVLLYVDFDMESELSFSGSEVTLGKGVFNAGTDVIVRAAGQTSTTTLAKASPRVITDCGGLTDSAQVLYYGTNLAGFRKEDAVSEVDEFGAQVTRDQRIVFDRPLNLGVSFTVTVPKKEAHTHVYESPEEYIPESVDPNDPNEEYAVQFELSSSFNIDDLLVFDANGYVPRSAYYLEPTEGTLAFDEEYVLAGGVSVYYETGSADVPHVHKMDKIVRGPGDAPTEYPLKSPALLDVPALILEDNKPRGATLRTDSVTFQAAPDAGTLYTVLYTSFGRNYRHLIPYAIEEEWNYKGRLKSAATLQNGIETPTVVLGEGDFELVDENGKLYVYTDTRIEEAWWTDVEFDDKALQNIWGDLLGLKGESTQQFANAVGAILAAARSSSSPDSIENFGSILLGSATTSQPGYYGGISEYDNTLTMLPAIPGDSAETLALVPGAKMRAPEQGCIPRNFAVQGLAQYVDLNKETLNWIPIVAETLSDTFKAAERLDQTTISARTSVPYSYEFELEILTDYSIDFVKEGIVPGDILRAKFGTINLDETYGTPQEDVFAVIKERLGPHRLRVALPIQQYVQSGYSENGYSEYGYSAGNQVSIAFVASYTVWGRRRGFLDVGRQLDTFDVNAVNRIQKVLAPFNFGVKLDWEAMKDTFSVESLGSMLDIAKPADTNAIVFAEAFENALADVTGGSLVAQGDPVVEMPPNSFAATESFIGLSSVVDDTGAYASLYDPGCPVFGAFVRGVTPREDRFAQEGEYYLASGNQAAESAFRELYSPSRGLENLLLKVSVPDYDFPDQVEYETMSSLEPRGMRGIRMGTSTASTVPLQHTEGDSITISMWLRFNWENVQLATDYDVFDWNGFSLVARTDAANSTYELRPTNVSSGTINGSAAVQPDQDYLVTYVYRYTGIANTLQLYLDGALIAEDTSTGADPDANQPFVLGGGSATPADMTVYAVDVRRVAMTATDVATYYAEQTMPRIGMNSDGSPMTFDDAILTLQLHSYNPLPIMADYSGNGNDATITGSDYSMQAGDLLVRLPQPGDSHIITTYETTDSAGTQPVPRASVYSPAFDYTNNGYVFGSTGDLRAGSGLVDNTQTTLDRDGATFTVPDVAYSRGLDGTWTKFFPNVVVPSSSFGYDDSAPYTGFPVT